MKMSRFSALVGLGLLLATIFTAHSQPYTFSTLTGNSGYGFANGLGNKARFNNPGGMAFFAASNILYVADTQNDVIRKISPDGNVSTFAGTPGVSGSKDGTNALFNLPQGIAADNSNNVYVADTANHVIRMITPAGLVNTIAGLAGSHGVSDGTNQNARFDLPQDIAVDASGVVYVADTGNQTIRKISSGGVVITLAGVTNTPGSINTADTANGIAEFNSPHGVAVDASGNIYVADTGNHTIRKIDSATNVTTLAGKPGFPGSINSTNSAARFDFPQGISTDTNGNIYVADTANDTLRMITPAGAVTTIAGVADNFGSADGTNSAARFNDPESVAASPGGNVLYVADTQNNVIREVAASGNVTTLAGLAGGPGSGDGTNSAARFDLPQGVAVDAAKNVYVADTQNSIIRRITPAGIVTTIAGLAGVPGIAEGTNSDARFFHPAGITVNGATNLFVADAGNNEIRQIAPSGANWTVSTIAGQPGAFYSGDITNSEDGITNITFIPITNEATFTNFSLVITNISGNSTNLSLLITNVPTLTNVVNGATNVVNLATNIFTLTNVIHNFEGPALGALFNQPSAVALDSFGNLYVADTGNSTIRLIANGRVSTFAGMTGTNGSADGGFGTNAFDHPQDVALDSTGNIYVADTVNCTIRMITPSGITSTLAGLAGASGHMDGTNKFARFKLPEALVVDPTGIIYVADTGNHSIRKIIPSGNNWVVTTIGGNPGFFGSEDGIGTNTLFNSPMGIALDDAGRLYVADTQNNTIRVGQAAPLGSPMLTILRLGNKVVLSWPASASSFNLETSGSLPGSNWVAVTNGIETSGTNLVLTNNIAPTNNFFRLHYP